MNRMLSPFRLAARLGRKWSEFIIYTSIGIASAIITISITYILTEGFHFWYLYSAVIAQPVGMAFHFFMNKNATFKNKSKRYASQISVFLAIASISYLLNIGLLYVFASIVKIWYVAAQVIVICMLFLLNYLAHKYITFGLIK